MSLSQKPDHETWFAADLHISHKRALDFRQPRFATVEEMNETIINNINEVVKPDDTLFLVGDIYLDGKAKTIEKYQEIRNSINAKTVHALAGNHCNLEKMIESEAFDSVSRLVEVKIRKWRIVICHYPLMFWGNSQYPKNLQLFGHLHLPTKFMENEEYNRVSVSVDSWNYYPASLTQIIKAIKERGTIPLDHHAAKQGEGNVLKE